MMDLRAIGSTALSMIAGLSMKSRGILLTNLISFYVNSGEELLKMTEREARVFQALRCVVELVYAGEGVDGER